VKQSVAGYYAAKDLQRESGGRGEEVSRAERAVEGGREALPGGFEIARYNSRSSRERDKERCRQLYSSFSLSGGGEVNTRQGGAGHRFSSVILCFISCEHIEFHFISLRCLKDAEQTPQSI
jgi:hypothetical protein